MVDSGATLNNSKPLLKEVPEGKSDAIKRRLAMKKTETGKK